MPTPEEIAAAEAKAKADADASKNKPDLSKEIEALKTRNAELDKKIAELTKKPNPEDDPSLLDKVRKQREESDKRQSDTKALENALRFNMQSAEFIKTNEKLLPKDIADIFKLAEKENYSNAIEKDAAIKADIIKSFFSVQANLDLLTPAVKTSLDDYLKLTKTGKQEKAQVIYDNIFEPAFEMLKRLKKAEVLNRDLKNEDTDEAAYKNKMIKLSRAHYLGEK